MAEELQMIDISLIDANPYEPRLTFRDSVVCGIADSVFAQRLGQPVLVRPHEARYERGFGQLRILAFWKLHELQWKTDTTGEAAPNPEIVSMYFEDGKTTRIPAIVRDMTDEELILTTLAENRFREPVPWLEETEAIQRALDARLGFTQRQLAKAMGLSTPNLSQRLSILRMPEGIRELMREGRLPWTNARLLTEFADRHHVHQQELEAIADYLHDQAGAITRQSVERAIELALDNFRQTWRRLRAGGRPWTTWPDAFHGEPMFDVDAFEQRNSSRIHTFELSGYKDVWTCKAQAWSAEQDRAREAKRQAFYEAAREEAARLEAAEPEAAPAPQNYRLLEAEVGAVGEQAQPSAAQVREVSSGNSQEDPTESVWGPAKRMHAQCFPFTTSDTEPHFHVEWVSRYDRKEMIYKVQSPPLGSREEATLYATDSTWRKEQGAKWWVVEHRFTLGD